MIRSIFLVLAAMTAIVVLEITAIRAGIDGKCLTIAVALLAGLGGYQAPKILQAFKKPKEEGKDNA